MNERTGHERRGPVTWMARNRVAANLLMVFLIAGGVLVGPTLKQEVFPEIQLDQVVVTVDYPGASPADVESGIILAVEDVVRGLDGVKEVRSFARENQGTVFAELLGSADRQQLMNEVESAVNRITSFPTEAEEPVVQLLSNRREVLSVILYGDVELRTLDLTAERIRSELLAQGAITLAEISGIPQPEISIEIPINSLIEFGLSLTEVAERLSRTSIELGAGAVDSPGGDVLLRTKQRRLTGQAYAAATLIRGEGTAERTVASVGTVIDGYAESDREAYYNGQRAVRIDVFRIGDQSPIDVSRAARDVVATAEPALPEGVSAALWNDSSEIYKDRRDLLLENAAIGALLVIVILGLFLRPQVAFWVTVGIPITFLGSFWLMPLAGVSINMISLFAFLLSLGIVVDDAIVVGEAAFWHRGKGKELLEAALDGVREVRTPITFAVLTTIVAFVPLLLLPGVIGKLIDNIPLIVIPILVLSLIESFFVLPAHLAHEGAITRNRVVARVERAQSRFARGVETFVDRYFRRWVALALRWRYVTMALGLAVLFVCVAIVGAGYLKFRFLPKIEGDIVIARLEMPVGTPLETTRAIAQDLVAKAAEAAEEAGGGDDIVRGIYADIGQAGGVGGGPGGDTTTPGGHLAEIAVFLVPADDREVSAADVTRRWRNNVGVIPGVDSLTYQFSIGPPTGRAVAIELSHEDEQVLEQAATELADALADYSGVVDIDSGVERGKEQIDLQLTDYARTLGLDEMALAQQVRAAFFGAEVERQQRGRDELRVYARLPAEQRASLETLERYRIRTPEGGEIPLERAATLERGRSYTTIQRQEGRRVIEVTADVEEAVTTGGEVTAALARDVLPDLEEKYPKLTWAPAGEQEEQMESLAALRTGLLAALLAMFVLVAVALGSYLEPLLVMLAIPFGLIGAVGGHLLMGFDISIISIFGVIALSGVVVNDSLVLMTAVNSERRDGCDPMEAAINASARRFRPIVLTSLTTFFGLAPIILETSVQARFLIPMAISLGFGILFATTITLFIVPSAYIIASDLRGLWRRVRRPRDPDSEPGGEPA